MTKRPGSGYDPRREPDEVETGERHNIDRVFRGGSSARSSGPIPVTPAPDAAPAPASLPPAESLSTMTGPPLPRTTTSDVRESELTLRRQLSRLQRQLADAQRELANKDEELAEQLEKQLFAAAEVTKAQEQLRAARARIDELTQKVTGSEDLEQRVQDALANASEIAKNLARERETRGELETKVAELAAKVAHDRARWMEERANLETQYASELDALEDERRVALETAVAAHDGDLMRLQQQHDQELAHLRESHERALAALRGELEPKVLEARNLGADRERLAAELASLRTEHTRALAEKQEHHKRELVQTAVAHGDELAAQARQYGAELARVSAERDAATASAAEAARAGQQREHLWESTVAQLRQQLKDREQELTTAREARTRLETDKAAADERLAAAAREVLALSDECRGLRERIEAADTELKRSSQDRARYIAYLEEGLAMLGALPAKSDSGPVRGGGSSGT